MNLQIFTLGLVVTSPKWRLEPGRVAADALRRKQDSAQESSADDAGRVQNKRTIKGSAPVAMEVVTRHPTILRAKASMTNARTSG